MNFSLFYKLDHKEIYMTYIHTHYMILITYAIYTLGQIILILHMPLLRRCLSESFFARLCALWKTFKEVLSIITFLNSISSIKQKHSVTYFEWPLGLMLGDHRIKKKKKKHFRTFHNFQDLIKPGSKSLTNERDSYNVSKIVIWCHILA